MKIHVFVYNIVFFCIIAIIQNIHAERFSQLSNSTFWNIIQTNPKLPLTTKSTSINSTYHINDTSTIKAEIFIKSFDNQFCLSNNNGGEIQVCPCDNNNINQKWSFDQEKSKLTNNANRCLTRIDNRFELNECQNNSDSQSWNIYDVVPNAIKIYANPSFSGNYTLLLVNNYTSQDLPYSIFSSPFSIEIPTGFQFIIQRNNNNSSIYTSDLAFVDKINDLSTTIIIKLLPGMIVYEQPNYFGASKFYYGRHLISSKIGSIMIDNDFRGVLWSNSNFSGSNTVFFEAIPNFFGNNVDGYVYGDTTCQISGGCGFGGFCGSNNVCECYAGFGFDGDGKRCDQCQPGFWGPNCTVCENGTRENNNCKCKKGWKTGTEGKCTECDKGFHLFENDCISCPYGCETCDGDGKCNECKSGTGCAPCDSSCVSCFSGGEFGCLSCSNGRVYSNGRCVKPAECVNETFVNSNKTFCNPCSNGCQSCHSEGKCSKCFEGYILDEEKCVKTCPDGKFKNQTICSACDQACNTCNGPSSEQCLSCADPKQSAYNGTCSTTPCPSSYFLVNTTCTKCHPECLECSGIKSNQCKKCPPSRPILTQDNFCVETCPKGKFVDSSGKCEPCHSSCSSCIGSQKCFGCAEKTKFLVNVNSNDTIPGRQRKTEEFAKNIDGNDVRNKMKELFPPVTKQLSKPKKSHSKSSPKSSSPEPLSRSRSSSIGSFEMIDKSGYV
ncbi:6071_t:CDS:10 [Diversispora eburnea]|uniref:6071_t:CDS:1 n=1 Tax=Diversispora eburnea TaxID=1213867 RepID=A0A9N8UV52_9GLOM|nr:6071_t:CDS:10 [Diversispora eburnea]